MKPSRRGYGRNCQRLAGQTQSSKVKLSPEYVTKEICFSGRHKKKEMQTAALYGELTGSWQIVIIIIIIIVKPMWTVASLQSFGHGGHMHPRSYKATFRRLGAPGLLWSTRGTSPCDVGLPTSEIGKVCQHPHGLVCRNIWVESGDMCPPLGQDVLQCRQSCWYGRKCLAGKNCPKKNLRNELKC